MTFREAYAILQREKAERVAVFSFAPTIAGRYAKAYDMAITALRDAQQWIPVAEKLPSNDDWKIVTVCDESGDRPYIYTDFGWYLEAANCWIIDAEHRTDVIAWKPLPLPYEEKV